MKTAPLLITEQSVREMRRTLDALPLPEGKARVCCFGCGSNLLVLAGYEHEALAGLRNHAQSHQDELSPDFHAAATDDVPTNALVMTQSWAVPREDVQN